MLGEIRQLLRTTLDKTTMSTTQWYDLYERLSIALSEVLEYTIPERLGRRAELARDLSSARAAVNAALGDALAAWNASYPDALLRLPPELTHDIFRWLELRDRIIVSHVSRRWRDMALSDPFHWNIATFSGRDTPASYTPPRRSRGHPTGPLRMKARILRELLARSAPVPFSLTWNDEMLPQRILDIVLKNLHRIQTLTAGLSRRSFQRLCALPAPDLRSLIGTRDSGRCIYPARWDAPVLQKLELLSLRFPAEGEIARLESIKELVLVEAPGLERRRIMLSAVFPALNSLEIAFFTPEMIPCLSTTPATLSSLTLIARRSIDYEPVLAALRRCRPKRLHLSSVRNVAPVLALFVSIVPGAWTMDIHPRADARAVIRTHFLSDEGDISFTIDDSEPLSFVREPGLASYLARVSSLTAPAHVLAQLDGLAQWDPRLPALRTLGLRYSQGTAWPASGLAPIRTPGLVCVSIYLHDTGPAWVVQRFPDVLWSRFVYDRPLLAQIKVKAKHPNGIQESWVAELRALSEVVIIDLGNETRVYAHK